MTETILIERDGAVATVLFNRPEKRNAYTTDMCRRLAEVFGELSADDEVRCVVLRGTGDAAFTAGADINEFALARRNAEEARAFNEIHRRAELAVRDCRHPTVAVVQGYCIGGGTGFALMCDLRLASRSARFGITANRISACYTSHLVEALLAVVGRAKALEILLEGALHDAEEAERIGLVNKVLDDHRLDDEVAATVTRIIEGGPLSARYHKRLVYRLAEPRPLSQAEIDTVHDICDTEDYRIGYTAFQNKEKPRFVGR